MPTTPIFSPVESSPHLRALSERWTGVEANERASFQTWFLELCAALGVPAPSPPTDDYRFELPVKVVDREGDLATNYIDAWHRGHFAMEAKMSEPGRNNDALLRRAFGQVRTYVSHVSGTPPPFLMVVDVPHTLIVWDRWSGSYGDFGAGRRIALGSLHTREDDIALLQDIFARPEARDPRGRAQAVTKEIASRLAALAAALEGRGLDQERVARFLMRCVFSCFAEDVGLLPEHLFRKTLEAAQSSRDPSRLKTALELLWKTMDEGGMFGAEMLHRFNGHFFKTREALPLEAADIALLIEATSYDWARVEPSIFGTLLVRALDPEERHRLGAEYTPREYIERLVEPTVVEPIRERWVAVQASVVQLEESGKKKDRDAALTSLLDFHEWMRTLRFLDPACGSGNFLYVTMAAVKRIEVEVLNELQRLSGGQGGLVLDEVHPRQFFGIEIKPWAREIAELTLWIGYHQFWRETHGGRTPPDPILEDTGTIECRDAVLAYDDVVHRPEKDRPDPTPRLKHPVTGELVPDPKATLPYYEHVNARAAMWPEADFIVGNPPYLGTQRQRSSFGDGYVEALRAAYPDVPDSADLVMYWWSAASQLVADGVAIRAGFIATSSMTQSFNRRVLDRLVGKDISVVWAIRNHPWIADIDSASVRVAMAVLARGIRPGFLQVVDDGSSKLESTGPVAISPGLDVQSGLSSATSQPLSANIGLVFRGVCLVGDGFRLDQEGAERVVEMEGRNREIVKRLVNATDLLERSRNQYVIDFGLMSESEAREYASLFDRIRSLVMPARQAQKRKSYRDFWWRFAEPRPELRGASVDMSRFFVTPMVSRHRLFVPLSTDNVPDQRLMTVALQDWWLFGVLSSLAHVVWASEAGGRHGVGNDIVYNNGVCFDPFPFPDPTPALRASIADLAERLDAHRKAAQDRDERVTMTGMYNVVEKLRSGEALTPKERTIHEIAACSILRDLHDELDRLVAEAYGWPWPLSREDILDRLVALHAERIAEEERGLIRWLRPDYQIPRFAPEQSLGISGADLNARTRGPGTTQAALADTITASPHPWPATAVEQITAIGALIAQHPRSTAEVAAAFTGAQPALVSRHLDTLALMGEITEGADGRYRGVHRAA
jgi:hypothetical protein